MVKYNAYIRAVKRTIKAEEGITLERAIDFLNETPLGIISDGKKEYTKEELEYAKSIRSLPGIGKDSFVAGFGKIHEDTDRELSSVIGDNTESSSERDSKWDKFS